ncbi:MAG: glycosyltransferase family 4 protein [Clostridia bacterium]|nr:glycosyltransferase family 4 protein [Clostridia bacterium]
MKILIIQNNILHYRKALYNLLSQSFEVNILHSGSKSISKNDLYKEIIVPVYRIGPFRIQKSILNKAYSNEFDVIIAMADLHWINNIFALFAHHKKSKFIFWGSWFTSKYFIDKIKVYLAKKANANIFYTENTKKSFASKGINSKKLFTANNTFDIGVRIKSFENPIKNKVLFVGSFDKRKQLEVLIMSFNNIIKSVDKNINLVLIGDGDEKNEIEKLINNLNLKKRIILTGKINEPERLRKYYQETIVSVSYGQAGLSVLQSLGFGVPFITHADAISGGEKHNIIHKRNGFFCKNQKELEDYLVQLCNNINEARIMGENSYSYYSNHCTIDNMAQGFIDAIEYVLK